MALQVVGAGFGRTGTLSLKNALEKIGFGPCYHMMEVFPRPEHVAMWHRSAFGGRSIGTSSSAIFGDGRLARRRDGGGKSPRIIPTPRCCCRCAIRKPGTKA